MKCETRWKKKTATLKLEMLYANEKSFTQSMQMFGSNRKQKKTFVVDFNI